MFGVGCTYAVGELRRTERVDEVEHQAVEVQHQDARKVVEAWLLSCSTRMRESRSKHRCVSKF